MSTSKKQQTFISYAHDDLDIVRKLYADLQERSVNVWFDKERIKPGRWKTQIQKAIPQSRYFLFCVSNSALQKTENGSGFVDDELQQAYEIAMAQDERHFVIVPVRLEEDLSHGDHRLSIFQQYDLVENWEDEVDKRAVYLGGEALATVIEKEEQSEEEKLIVALRGKAEASYYAQEYHKALLFYGVLVSINSDYALAWNGKGVALSKLGRNEEALKAYDEAIRLNPDYDLAWNNKGTRLRVLGRYEEALDVFEKALIVNPENHKWWNAKGGSLFRLKRYEEALAACEEALTLYPDYAHVWSNKGETLNQLGRHEEAVVASEKAISLMPDHSEAWNNKGVAFKALGKMEEAALAIEKARELGFYGD